MKSKKLLFSTLVSFIALAIFIVFSSHSTGQMGVANFGCGGSGCHGSASNTNTIIAFTGIPGQGYTPGSTYAVSAVIYNSGSSFTKSGFDLKFSEGTISGAPSNTMTMGTELHHTSPFTAVSGTTTINFNWTAPTTGNVVSLYISGNAVNNNNSESGDEWNVGTYSFSKANVASVADITGIKIDVYPNPTLNNITFKSSEKIVSAKAIDMLGRVVNLENTVSGTNSVTVNTSILRVGNYVIMIQGMDKKYYSVFTKM